MLLSVQKVNKRSLRRLYQCPQQICVSVCACVCVSVGGSLLMRVSASECVGSSAMAFMFARVGAHLSVCVCVWAK